MFARRLSVLLSILAMGLMVLACSLGYRGDASDRTAEPVQVATPAALAPVQPTAERCRQLDVQLDRCASEVQRAWHPAVPTHYPERLRRLIAIKKRYLLEDEAARACKGEPDAPVAGAALDGCLARVTCDDFAQCLADNLDDF